MGKGDRKTRKGKIHRKTYGVSRLRSTKQQKQNNDKKMNIIQEYYDFLNNNEFDCNSKAELDIELKNLCNSYIQKSEQENAILCEFERQILFINKSFKYKEDEAKGTVNGLSYMFAGTQTLEDGSEIPIYFPDVTKLIKTDFEYCEKRYKECNNLFMKTEYGLMVYFGQQTDYSKRNDFKKQLCNELFNLAKQYYAKTIQGGEKNHYVMDFYRILELSYTIAEKVKLEDEINNLVKYIFETHQSWDVTKDGTLRILLDLSCLMSDSFKAFKDKIDFNKVIEKNIEGAKELEKTYLWGALYAIDKNLIIEQQLGLSKEKSVRYKAEIYEKMMNDGEGKDNSLVAVKFAEDALRLYQSLKDQNKIDELSKKYDELRGKIRLTEHRHEMPQEYTDHISENIQKALAESDEKDVLAHFILTPWYSNISEIQKNADTISKQSILSAMAATSILDKFGNTIDTFNTEEEIKEHNFWQSYSFNFQLGTQTMHQFFIEAYKAGKLNYQSTMDYLEMTWLNELIIRNYHTNYVEIKPLDTLRPSLKRLFEELDLFFADNSHLFDYVTITDSLTLKVESILRNFCETISIPTFKTRQKGADKLVMEKLIDDLLNDLKHSTENPTNFDEEDRLFIKYILTEKSGLNLRNKVAHGLMDFNEYSFVNILLLFSIIMKLSKYKFTPITT
jgi:ribosomal small subunit protein bTHX